MSIVSRAGGFVGICLFVVVVAGSRLASAGPPPPIVCGDGVCDPTLMESCVTCPADCGLCPSTCGNGIVEVGEQCDDGNTVDGDGCSATCLIEGACGDGFCSLGFEDCFTCPADCPCAPCGDAICDFVAGESCMSCPVDCGPCGGLCGDGLIQPGEECDLTNLGGETCVSQGFGGGTLACLPICLFDTSGCMGPTGTCGNGLIEGGEECDDGNTTDGDGCSALCEVEPVCGDGTVDTGEECDDGNVSDGDGCSATCTIEVPACGDGNVDPGEECDDGNVVDGDGCSSACVVEGMGVCGDGVIGFGEWCDDGNVIDGDGCSSTCMIETPPMCGDGNVDPGEECEPPGVPGCDDDCQEIGASSGCSCGLPGRGAAGTSAAAVFLVAAVIGLGLRRRRRR